MLKIKIPFGFKTIQLDNLFVFYTGKIRVKEDYEVVIRKLQHVEGLSYTQSTKGCIIISYMVTDYHTHTSNIRSINSLLRDVMIHRIENKYRDWSATNKYTSSIDLDEVCL